MLINWQALKKHKQEAPLLVIDIFVLGLITLNLILLLIDTLLMYTGFGLLFSEWHPDFYQHYQQHWHKKITIYDSIFTIFLLVELGLRWLLAIYRKTYHRWFFYPFIHWYDVLACLPGLQFLRLLRLVSVFYRLHTLGIIVVGTRLIKTAQKYYGIVIEEISDRIVLNVLDGVQKELRSNNPVMSDLRANVLVPHKAIISRWLANRIGAFTTRAYQQHEQELAHYLTQTIEHTLRHNSEWRQMKRRLPLIGNMIESEVQQLLSSLVNDLTRNMLQDLSQTDNAALKDLADAAFDTFTLSDAEMDHAIESIMVEAIELIKSQVAIQQWKIDEQQEIENPIDAKLNTDKTQPLP
ncbi:ion transporter [Agitococcus lubricus]|uniref:Ion transporter n=1 Tax=Agitococcus lubricus TaxID=1077255 RepID=A0A2T5IWK8_9GAMM|nr:ion transporter [Agitococcus lubricus]PTQ88291.1 hypothetical protein C8N29_11358 [Agitococcus lubricus]